jgi:alpha-tubulin suppressor-like RCC1 family protein
VNAVTNRPTKPESKGEQALPAEAPTSGGPAVAWGENYFGQLGVIYKGNYELSPVGVEGLSNITEIAATSSFNLALLSDGTLASWGGNDHGQLGDDTKKANWERGISHTVVEEESPSTHQVLGPLHGVKAIAAANEHALALIQGGTVMAWGNDEYGQLGDGEQGFERQININERLPKIVPGLTQIKAIAAGGGSDYALTAHGTIMAWGNNTSGQLGLGKPGPDHCETAVAHFPKYELCSERPLPVMWHNPASGKEEELSAVKSVAAGAFATYALLNNGHVLSWGGNHTGELGTGAETWRAREFPPSEVLRANGEAISGVVELAAGSDFALARLADGEILGWGNTAQGALAGASAEDCRRPAAAQKNTTGEPRSCVKLATQIPALEKLGAQALSAGQHFGLALSAGNVYAWGSNERGQLGNGASPRGKPNPAGGREKESGYPVPTRVAGSAAARAVAAGGTHTVVLLSSESPLPAPLITVTPEALALKLAWQPETVNGTEEVVAERLLYRRFEHIAETEPAEQGKTAEEEGPPVNVEPPEITRTGEWIENEAPTEGEKLTAEPGSWSGARPIKFSYQWQRCAGTGELCSNIRSAVHPSYTVSAGDVGSSLRVLVTATGAEPPAASSASALTENVEGAQEGERDKASATSIRLTGLEFGYTIHETIEKSLSKGHPRRVVEVKRPLQAVPYLVRFTASKRTRVMALTPFP